jgi:hypothetical protein
MSFEERVRGCMNIEHGSHGSGWTASGRLERRQKLRLHILGLQKFKNILGEENMSLETFEQYNMCLRQTQNTCIVQQHPDTFEGM